MKIIKRNGSEAEFNIDKIDQLIESYQNKIKELEKLNNEFKERIDATKNNLSAAGSHVQNIATAEEIISKTKSSIMKETKVAMLSQANKKPEQVKVLLE